MEHQAIKEALQQKGVSFTAIAQVINKTPQAVTSVAARRTESQLIAMAIATALELPVGEVFPDIPRYAKKRETNDSRKKRAEKLLAGWVA